MAKKRLAPRSKNSSAFHYHGSRLSQLLTDLTRKAHATKLTFKHQENKHFISLPLLLAIVIFLIVPIFAAIALIYFLLVDYDISTHQEEG